MMKNIALSFTSIFVALDVIGMLPLFLTMTRTLSKKERAHIINQSMLVALIVAIIFAFLGQRVFSYLGIALFDFKIAGGLILLLISLADVVGGPDVANQSSGSTGVVPLAVPLITGPSVLTTVMFQVGTWGYGLTLASLGLNYLLAWAMLRKSESITKLIGKDGTVVASKVAALLLVAISISMIRLGLFEAIHAYAKSP